MTLEAGDILSIILEYSYPGASQALNIFNSVFSGNPATDDEALDALEDWATDEWGVNWSSLADDQTVLDTLKVQVVDSAGVVIRDVGSRLLNIEGDAISGSVSPAAVAGYIQADTVLPRVMGRKYVPGIDENQIDQGLFGVGAAVTLVMLLADYIVDVDMVSGGKLSAGVISVSKPGFQTFQGSGNVETVPAYQRRRKEGVGS